MPIPGITDSLIAAFIADAAKKVWALLDDHLDSAAVETARHFNRDPRKIKFKARSIKDLMNSETGEAEIQKFWKGESLIDTAVLSEQLLDQGGLDTSEMSKDESRQIAVEIMEHFRESFTTRLLQDDTVRAQTLNVFQHIFAEKLGRDHGAILEAIKGLYSLFPLLAQILEKIEGKQRDYPVLDLPPRPINFVGREEEIEQLMADLHPGREAALCGPGGIGKTAIASEAIHRHLEEIRQRFPDGMIFHSFYTTPEADKCLEQIALFFHEEARPSPELAARRVLAGRKVLLFLDGCEDADRLDRVKAVAGGCGLLVTSRAKKDSEGQCQNIPVLEQDCALDLLRKWAGESVADEDAAHRVCDLLGGLPLAVRLAGHYISRTGMVVSEYLTWLEKLPLEALNHGKRKIDSVTVLIGKSFARLSGQSLAVIESASLLSFAPIPKDVIITVLNKASTELFSLLEELIDFGIFTYDGYRFMFAHSLIYQYAKRKSHPNLETVDRTARAYINFANELRNKGLNGFQSMSVVRLHTINLISVCYKMDLYGRVFEIIEVVDEYLRLQGYWKDRLKANKFGATAANIIRNENLETGFLIDIGNTFSLLGEHGEALTYYRKALKMARSNNCLINEESCLGNMGILYKNLSEPQKAIDFYERSIKIAKNIADRMSEANGIMGVGNCYLDMGEEEAAVEYIQDALDIYEEINHTPGVGGALNDLGNIYFYSDDFEKAIKYHTKALAIFQEIGDRSMEAKCIGNLGNSYKALGNAEKALENYNVALEILTSINDSRGEAVLCLNIGNFLGSIGKRELAFKYHSNALEIFRKIGSRDGEGTTLLNMGSDFFNSGQVQNAKKYWKASMNIFDEINSPSVEKVRDLLESINSTDREDEDV